MSEEQTLAMPKRTTPTWEIELLISGATAFGLIQLLGASNDWFLRLQTSINDAVMTTLISPLQIYARITLICLIVAVLVHLVVRAYWVGLIGLHSVYRGPPDISKLHAGPFSRRNMTTENKDVLEQIDHADNLASLIFGYGIGMALIMLIPSALVLIALGVALLLSIFLPSLLAMKIAMFALLLPVFVLTLLPTLIDQYWGERIRPESLLGRYLTRHFQVMKKYSYLAGSNLIVVYLMSKAGSYRGAMIGSAIAGFLLAMVAVIDMPRLKNMQDREDLSTDWEVSDYASERGGSLVHARRPYIAAPQLRGDYLEVSVPVPNKTPSGGHGPCSKDDKRKLFISCLKRELKLRIGDKRFAADWLLVSARNGQPPTLRAFIDVRELPRGKHVLHIDYPYSRKHHDKAWREIIHFWK